MVEYSHIRSFIMILMRTVISFVIALIFGSFMLAPLAFAIGPSEDILAEILKGQGVTEKTALDCDRISNTDAARYGEAVFAESLDTGSEEYKALIAGFSSEKLTSIYQETGLRNLGCAVDAVKAMPIAALTDIIPSDIKVENLAVRTGVAAGIPFGGQSISFIATWTTIVWMFSALGFAVFMVWITSSKFRFQFRKMAEGEFDMNDKAMTILKERFARGEVTKEQFDKMRRDILN